MPENSKLEHGGEEVRLDADLQQKVVALASRLKLLHDETLSIDQLVEIGKEVGLEAEFVEKATREIVRERTETLPARKRHVRTERGQSRAAALVVATALPLLWGALTLALRIYGAPKETLDFLWYAGYPMCMVLGALAASEEIGFFGGILLMVMAIATRGADHPSYLLTILGGFLGAMGAEARTGKGAKPVPKDEEDRPQGKSQASRTELLEQLFEIQQKLASQQRNAAFLSVDVVGSTDLKLGEQPLDVEYTFAKYRAWVEGIVEAHGGRIQVSAGDGAMCLFASGESAVRAAREIQDGAAEFNAQSNRLARPLRFRCGVSSGQVAIDDSQPIGHLHSPVIDRAALLQRQAGPGDIVVDGPTVPDAVGVLGQLAPLDEPVGGLKAFTWKRGPEAPTA